MVRILTRLCVLSLLVAAAASSAQSDEAKPLLPNGAFEEGDERPAKWTLAGDGSWSKGGGRNSGRFLTATDNGDHPAWESDVVNLSHRVEYRLEGWVRSPNGQGRLGVFDIDRRSGGPALNDETPSIRNSADWRYVAIDFQNFQHKAVVSLKATGSADFDDVALVPVATNYMANRDVQPDAKGRIGFWGEEKDDSILRGTRRGSHRSDPTTKRRDVPALLVEATGDWYAVSSVNYPMPAFTNRIELSGWARAEGSARAQISACWMDDSQKVIGVETGQEVSGADWDSIVLAPKIPPNAHTVRLVALARGGRVWFDDFNLKHLRPTERRVRVFVNQIGYELTGPKCAVVATNFFPEDRTTIIVQAVDADGKVALEKEVPCAGRIYSGRNDDWGWYFWRADFSELRREGTYRAVAEAGSKLADTEAKALQRRGPAGSTRGESFPFVVERGALLSRTAQSAVDFFYVQRCGFEVSGWHKACHLDDAKLPDGSHVDVTGGWHSAGDYNKPMWQFGDSGSSYALAVAYAAHPELFGRFDRDKASVPDALDEAWWGAKFLAKMQNPADGSMRGDVLQGPARTWMKWSAPDDHTDNKIGTPDDPVIAAGNGNVPLTIAAWAALSRAPLGHDVQRDYTARAERLWSFLTASDGAAANPLLLISVLELYRTTHKDTYREFARPGAQMLVKQQRPNGSLPGDSGDHGDVAAAALALYVLQFGDDPQRDTIVDALKRYLEFCLARADNPFGLTRQGTEEPEATFFHPSVGMGVNFWILGRAWSALLIHQLTNDARALVYATDQIDWVLGKNPLNLCMFEGHGGLNPPRYHHRYNMIAGHERGAVPGAIPNGIVRDMGIADRPGFDMSRAGGRSPSFRTSEPWLVHNMFYLLATSALAQSTDAH